MRIVEIDNTNSPVTERVVFEATVPKAQLCKELVTLASNFCATTPNNPFVDLTGPKEISCLIGVQKIRTWRMEY